MLGRCGKLNRSYTADGKVWLFLKKLNIQLLCNPIIALLGINVREIKIYFHTKTCTQINVHCRLSVIAQSWKQPRCPLKGEWLNKLWYMYAMEYYSGIKRTIHTWNNTT